MLYIYEGHIGGRLYATTEELSYEKLCCEMCGDRDWMIECVKTKKQLKKLLKKYDYTSSEIDEWLKEWEHELEVN